MSLTTVAFASLIFAVSGLTLLLVSALQGQSRQGELRRSLARLVEQRWGAIWIVAVPDEVEVEETSPLDGAPLREPVTPADFFERWALRRARILSHASLEGVVWRGTPGAMENVAARLAALAERGLVRSSGSSLYAIVCVSRQRPPTRRDLADVASYVGDASAVAIVACRASPFERRHILDWTGWFLCACALVTGALGGAEWLGLVVRLPPTQGVAVDSEAAPPAPDAESHGRSESGAADAGGW